MFKYRSIYSTDFSAFQVLCREDLQRKVREEGATREAFEDDYVSLKTNAGIHKVKYTGSCRFNRPRQVASRGTTWFRDGDWYFTMPKFPNGCQSKDFFGVEESVVVDDLKAQGYSIEYMPKWDGSAIHLFRHDGVTHAYTLGCLNREMKMQGAFPDSPTFFDLAIELFRAQYPDGETWLDENPGCGLVFEMCSRWNLIVTQYEDLGERGRLHPLVVVEADGSLSWRFPAGMRGDHISWTPTTTTDLGEFESKLFQRLVDERRFGTNPEGLVSYAVKRDTDGVAHVVHPLFKKKRPEYLHDHRQVVLQPGSANDLHHVCEAVIQETYDDWIHPCAEVKALRDRYRDLVEDYIASLAALFRKVEDETRIDHLVVLDGEDYRGQENRGRFARYIKELGLPNWLMSGLFQMHTDGALFGENSSEDTIKTILLGVLREPKEGEIGITRLASLQRNGPFWFDPSQGAEPHLFDDYVPVEIPEWKGELGLAVFDWDHTVAPCRDGQATSYYEDPETLEAPYPSFVLMMKAYLDAGWRVVVLTGRLYRVRDRIRELLHQVDLDQVEVFCCPPKGNRKMETVQFKKETVIHLSEGMHTVVHFDDDTRVLQALSPTPHESVRYVPYEAGGSKVTPYIQGHKPVVMLQVGPPAAGKTRFASEIRPLLEAKGRTFTTTGFDGVKLRHKRERKEDEDEAHLSSEELYEIVMREIRTSLRPSSVVYVDMCHDGTSVIKRLKQMHSRGQIHLFMFTTMRLDKVTTKNKNGKTRQEVKLNEDYLAELITRAHARIDDPSDLSSTLTHHEKVEEVIRHKAEGCIRTVTNPAMDIIHLRQELATPRDWAVEVMTLIGEALDQVVVTESYLALPIPRRLLPSTPDGISPIALPHVTMAFGLDVPPTLPLVGTAHRVSLYQTVSDGKAMAVIAQTDPGSKQYGDHVTVGVASGVPPVHAKTLVTAPTGEPVLYKSTLVPM